jgi:F0F1-type ATP synthase delta subunit
MLASHIKLLFMDRRKILKSKIWHYAKQQDEPIRVVYAKLYSAYELETKQKLPHLAKLDYICERNNLDILERIVEEIIDMK